MVSTCGAEVGNDIGVVGEGKCAAAAADESLQGAEL